MFAVSSFALLAPLLAPQGSSLPSLHVANGQSLVFSVGGGVLELEELSIGEGGRLRFTSTCCPVHVHVRGTMRIDGVLDVSGSGAPNGIGVATFNTTNIQEPGHPGGPGGAPGGTGNRIHFASSAVGGDGGCDVSGGRGGESGYAQLPPSFRHVGGGGGGAFGPAMPPVSADPFDPANNGRIALAGVGGNVFSAVHPFVNAAGGAAGTSPFADGNPANDFWGRRVDPVTQLVVVGELAGPRGGSGGGAGGNSIASSVFPNPAWSPIGDEKGAGGGGGGGLLLVRARLIEVGAQGRVTADGGRGGTGENTVGINVVGGSSGGGSGGMLVLAARRIDLSFASNGCLTALGGDGGRGADNTVSGAGAGGDGGPGLIQLHLANGLADVALSGGRTLADMSYPEALVLLPEPGI